MSSRRPLALKIKNVVNNTFFGIRNFKLCKWWNTDRLDKNTVLITVDNISSPDYPEFFYWPDRTKNHQCFQNGNSRSVAKPIILDQQVIQMGHEKDAENIRGVVIKKGEVRRLKFN